MTVIPVSVLEPTMAPTVSDIVSARLVPLTVIASASSVPSISTSPDISSDTAITDDLKVAAPSALPSSVSIVISAPPSVPLNIISVSLAAASIVISPELVVIVTAASPADTSSAATSLALSLV